MNKLTFYNELKALNNICNNICYRKVVKISQQIKKIVTYPL